MITPPTLDGITSQTITTARITTRVLFCGPEDGTPVLFLHGNASSATFWEEVMLALPPGYRAIAPDQRGYGGSDPEKKIDATRGLGDLADDALALLDHLGLERVYLIAHSMGGAATWLLMIQAPQRLQTVTQVCPGSPYGYGGTKDLDGTPCYDDFAGSGGGIVNQEFARAIAAGDRSSGQASPRTIMNNFYFKPPFKPAREEDLLTSVLSMRIGDQDYPGDIVLSPNWPNVAPGVWGQANGLSPKYAGDVSRLYHIDPKPPVLWVRGSHDQIISDQSMLDVGTLGALGAIPGWPGADVYPSQPMVGQTRAVLEEYQRAGGAFTEAVIEDTGHSPYIEKPDEFNRLFHTHLTA
jgi:pimeloyl-ACP methyl ester carboxylesterase